MGLIRKTMSLGSLGLVDFRSDRERTAAYAKATKRQAEQQTRLLRQQVAMQQAEQAPVPPDMPARWYPDPSGAPCLRYWDGRKWTKDTAPLPQ